MTAIVDSISKTVWSTTESTEVISIGIDRLVGYRAEGVRADICARFPYDLPTVVDVIGKSECFAECTRSVTV